uniref:Integrase catalytic domain-containing protein n=1 Tax=Macrostomum lignano TaxID=282301 RepID=A0A1I8FJY4_9PLAT
VRIKHRRICPLHPEANGATERVNRCIQQKGHQSGHRRRTQLAHAQLDDWLLRVIASLSHSATGVAPAELLMAELSNDGLPSIPNHRNLCSTTGAETRKAPRRATTTQMAAGGPRQANVKPGSAVLRKRTRHTKIQNAAFRLEPWTVTDRRGDSYVLRQGDADMHIAHADLTHIRALSSDARDSTTRSGALAPPSPERGIAERRTPESGPRTSLSATEFDGPLAALRWSRPQELVTGELVAVLRYSMERKLRGRRLEAGDSEEAGKRLCGEVGSNIELERFLKLPLAHHVACKPKSDNSNLKWLVKELGQRLSHKFLTRGRPSIVAAEHQKASSRWSGSRDRSELTFSDEGMMMRTAFHFAGSESDNSNLKWLVKKLGSDCSQFADRLVTRPSICALGVSTVDSLQFFFDQMRAEITTRAKTRPADIVEKSLVATQTSQQSGPGFPPTQRGSKPLGLPLAAQRRLAAQLGAKKQLDPAASPTGTVNPAGQQEGQLIGRGGFVPQCEQKSDGLYIFTDELVSGHSLFELMQRQKASRSRSPRGICSGLNFLHCQPEGAILHRDIKSSNVMLTSKASSS